MHEPDRAATRHGFWSQLPRYALAAAVLAFADDAVSLFEISGTYRALVVAAVTGFSLAWIVFATLQMDRIRALFKIDDPSISDQQRLERQTNYGGLLLWSAAPFLLLFTYTLKSAFNPSPIEWYEGLARSESRLKQDFDLQLRIGEKIETKNRGFILKGYDYSSNKIDLLPIGFDPWFFHNVVFSFQAKRECGFEYFDRRRGELMTLVVLDDASGKIRLGLVLQEIPPIEMPPERPKGSNQCPTCVLETSAASFCPPEKQRKGLDQLVREAKPVTP